MTRRMTRALAPAALALAAALAALVGSACGRRVSPNTVVLWHSYRGAERQALDKLVHAFNTQERERAHRRPGYRPTRVRLLQISFENLPNKVTNAVPRGNGPDLFIFAHDRLGDWVHKDLVEPLGYWVGPAEAKRFLPKTLRAFASGGRLYGLPLAYKSVALFYHTDLIGRDPPATTADLVARGRRFMRARGRGYYGLVYEATDTYFHAPWLFGFGGRFLTPCDAGERAPGRCGGAKMPIASPAAVRALRFARGLAGRGGITPHEVNGQLVTSLFISKRAAMAITGPWFLSDLQTAGRRRALRYRVAPLPRISEAGGRPAAPLLTVEGIFLSRRSRHKARAFRVMAALTSDRAARLRVRLARQLPANVAVDRLVSSPQSSLHSPALAAFRRQLETAHLTPATPLMRVVWQPYKQALAAAIARGEDPKASLEKAAREIRRAVGPCLRAHGKEGR